MGRFFAGAELGDLDLIQLAQDGDRDAFGELWNRHSRAVVLAVRSFTTFDPEDVCQEAFLRIWERLQAGKGPRATFRAYAIVTARSIASDMGRRRAGTEVTGLSTEVLDGLAEPVGDAAARFVADHFTTSVFRSLSPRWREVLWYRDVEGFPVRELSQYLGISENSTSVLLKRAREGFKQAWIAAQLEVTARSSKVCRWTDERLPQYVRGRSSKSARQKIESHLSDCERCRRIAGESEDLNRRLAFGNAARTRPSGSDPRSGSSGCAIQRLATLAQRAGGDAEDDDRETAVIGSAGRSTHRQRTARVAWAGD